MHSLRQRLAGAAYGISIVVVSIFILGVVVDKFIPLLPKYSGDITLDKLLSVRPGDKCSNAVSTMGTPVAESVAKWVTSKEAKTIYQTRYDYGISGLLYGPYQIMLFCENGYVDIVMVEKSEGLFEQLVYYCDKRKCPHEYNEVLLLGLESYIH